MTKKKNAEEKRKKGIPDTEALAPPATAYEAPSESEVKRGGEKKMPQSLFMHRV